MSSDLFEWRNFSPGDLTFEFPLARSGDVTAAVEKSKKAFPTWASLSLDERREALLTCRERLRIHSEALAELIAREIGKPIREAREELRAVIAKFDFCFADAERYVRDESISEGPHPGMIRHRPRGPAAVIAPFNFPIHLGHGVALAYLLAGNTVLFKPSPLAVNVAMAYAKEMQAALPMDVFQLIPGWGEAGRVLCLHPDVHSVCFTGSIPVGTDLARALASDYSKSLSLELGGKNSAIICRDADLKAAAASVADGMCLTAGQRCNATSRVMVHSQAAVEFLDYLYESLARYQPGDPLNENTTLGPLVSKSARERYSSLTSTRVGEWILPGRLEDRIATGQRGFYVHPAVVKISDIAVLDTSPLATQEIFAPILVVESFKNEEDAIVRHEAWDYGLTASIFTKDKEMFQRIGDSLTVGNLYWNLPTTFSPSTLPFGGWKKSGNGHPGGRGFIRFAVKEQAVQWK